MVLLFIGISHCKVSAMFSYFQSGPSKKNKSDRENKVGIYFFPCKAILEEQTIDSPNG